MKTTPWMCRSAIGHWRPGPSRERVTCTGQRARALLGTYNPKPNRRSHRATRAGDVEDAMKGRYVMVALVLAATAVGDAKEPLSIRVSPAFSFAPANLVSRTSVDRS